MFIKNTSNWSVFYSHLQLANPLDKQNTQKKDIKIYVTESSSISNHIENKYKLFKWKNAMQIIMD